MENIFTLKENKQKEEENNINLLKGTTNKLFNCTDIYYNALHHNIDFFTVKSPLNLLTEKSILLLKKNNINSVNKETIKNNKNNLKGLNYTSPFSPFVQNKSKAK